MSAIQRVGILTGGGDCPGLNAVLRAAVKSATRDYGMEVVGIHEGFGGLVRDHWRLLSDGDVSGILPRGGTIIGTSNRDNPFSYPVSSNGSTTREDLSGLAIENLEGMGVEALVVVGGDGSQSIGLRLFEMGVPVVGVPKTIDNDLMATDITFGFDSALQTATEAVDKLHTTAESHNRAMFLEVMGRNSGWIALMSGMAGGGDVILMPEIPFTYESVARSIVERNRHGKKFSIVVVAEGCRLPDGSVVARTTNGTHQLLGGVADRVAMEVEALAKTEARVTVLGHLQRGGPPSPFDRVLATRFGVKAIEMVAAGAFGMMAALKTPCVTSVPLEEAVREQRKVPVDGELVRAARSVGTCFGDR